MTAQYSSLIPLKQQNSYEGLNQVIAGACCIPTLDRLKITIIIPDDIPFASKELPEEMREEIAACLKKNTTLKTLHFVRFVKLITLFLRLTSAPSAINS